jgi:hypothetical protein
MDDSMLATCYREPFFIYNSLSNELSIVVHSWFVVMYDYFK